jgi:hypothetical protein
MANLESGFSVNNLNGLKVKIQVALVDALKEAALNIETLAKVDCPVNMGILRSSIHTEPISEQNYYGYKIGSYLPYAPYVEFGTGTLVSVPSEYQEFALQFKGQKEVAGMNAQPYLLPNFEMQVEQFKNNIQKVLNNV